METSLREVLAPLRPSANVVAELTELFGQDSPAVKALGRVNVADLSDHALMLGELEADAELVAVSDVAVRSGLERSYSRLLGEHDAEHLDVTDVTSRNRALTQGLARALYDDGAAGVLYTSNIDGVPCVALFERRARLEATGIPATALPDAVPLVRAACADLGLTLVESR